MQLGVGPQLNITYCVGCAVQDGSCQTKVSCQTVALHHAPQPKHTIYVLVTCHQHIPQLRAIALRTVSRNTCTTEYGILQASAFTYYTSPSDVGWMSELSQCQHVVHLSRCCQPLSEGSSCVPMQGMTTPCCCCCYAHTGPATDETTNSSSKSASSVCHARRCIVSTLNAANPS